MIKIDKYTIDCALPNASACCGPVIVCPRPLIKSSLEDEKYFPAFCALLKSLGENPDLKNTTKYATRAPSISMTPASRYAYDSSLPSTSDSPSVLSIASSQYARVNGFCSFPARMESLLGAMTSCVSGSRRSVLVRRSAFFFSERMERSFTGFRGAMRISPSTVSGLSHAKESATNSSNPRSITKIRIADKGRGRGTTT